MGIFSDLFSQLAQGSQSRSKRALMKAVFQQAASNPRQALRDFAQDQNANSNPEDQTALTNLVSYAAGYGRGNPNANNVDQEFDQYAANQNNFSDVFETQRYAEEQYANERRMAESAAAEQVYANEQRAQEAQQLAARQVTEQQVAAQQAAEAQAANQNQIAQDQQTAQENDPESQSVEALSQAAVDDPGSAYNEMEDTEFLEEQNQARAKKMLAIGAGVALAGVVEETEAEDPFAPAKKTSGVQDSESDASQDSDAEREAALEGNLSSDEQEAVLSSDPANAPPTSANNLNEPETPAVETAQDSGPAPAQEPSAAELEQLNNPEPESATQSSEDASNNNDNDARERELAAGLAAAANQPVLAMAAPELEVPATPALESTPMPQPTPTPTPAAVTQEPDPTATPEPTSANAENKQNTTFMDTLGDGKGADLGKAILEWRDAFSKKPEPVPATPTASESPTPVETSTPATTPATNTPGPTPEQQKAFDQQAALDGEHGEEAKAAAHAKQLKEAEALQNPQSGASAEPKAAQGATGPSAANDGLLSPPSMSAPTPGATGSVTPFPGRGRSASRDQDHEEESTGTMGPR